MVATCLLAKLLWRGNVLLLFPIDWVAAIGVRKTVDRKGRAIEAFKMLEE